MEQTVASAHQSSQTQGFPTGLVGEINETNVLINGLQIKGLIDTGATVSTLSEDFYQKHLKEFQLCSLSSVLEIECADGEQLPYTGYIEVDIGMICGDKNISGTYPILVVPATPYNRNVPLLLGTNILRHLQQECQQHFGARYLQHSITETPWWLAFRSLTLREKQLTRSQGRVGTVKSNITEKFILPGNRRVKIPAIICNQMITDESLVMYSPTSSSSYGKSVEITPTVTNLMKEEHKHVTVEM